MTAAAVHDALAAKIANLSSLKVAYGDGRTGTVSTWPAKVVSMPAVLVRRGPTSRAPHISRQLYVRQFDADFYLPLPRSGAFAIQAINDLDDQLLEEFVSGWTLDGVVDVCRYLGSDPPRYVEEGEDEATIQYVVWTAHFSTEERVGVNYTP